MPVDDSHSGAGRPRFLTTAWSVVLAAAQDGAPGADDSLARLCQAYWKPIYAFILHRRHSAPDAEDLTQEFFSQLIADRTLRRADRTRGRFRSFLLGALRRFLADDVVRRSALKRGAGHEIVSLSTLGEPEMPVAAGASAEDEFEARWARALFDATLAQLREEILAEDHAARWDTLRRFLPGGGAAPPSYADAARALGLSEAALKSIIHRLRARYRVALRRQVARTVGAPHEIDDEIRHLCAAAARLGEAPPAAA